MAVDEILSSRHHFVIREYNFNESSRFEHRGLPVIIAPVPHLNKSLARSNKNPFYQGFSHRDSDYKLA